MKNPLEFRVWDPQRKVLAEVWELIKTPGSSVWKVRAAFPNEGFVDFAGLGSILMQSLGIKDDTGNMLFEEDLVDFLADTPVGWKKIRGRVIYNESTSYGPVGPVILDEFGSIHSFDATTSLKKVGNSFTGVTK